MWEYLGKMPYILSASIFALLIIAIIIIALRGKIRAKFGDKEIDLGGANDPATSGNIKSSNGNISEPPPTVSLITHRSCGDCVLLLIGEREKYELQLRRETDRILETQMVYAEQKLTEVMTILMDDLELTVEESFQDEEGSKVDSSIQNKLLYGLFKDAIWICGKDEIRRSFKNNGFYQKNGMDLVNYSKNQASAIINKIIDTVKLTYPSREEILGIDEIIETIDRNSKTLTDIISDVYVNAREVKIDTEKRVNELKTQFGKWVDNFIKK